MTDIQKAATELYYASRNYARLHPEHDAWLGKLSDLPSLSPEQQAAYNEIIAVGRRLYEEGGNALMARVYDAAVDEYDYAGVRFVNSAWDRIGDWRA